MEEEDKDEKDDVSLFLMAWHLMLMVLCQFVPSKMFDDKELKRLLEGRLLTMVVDMGLGAREKVGRKGKKVVDPMARAAFQERVGVVSGHFLVNGLLLTFVV